jgi:2-C-methyl-D-erythritol 4-phosphate cytidylyltransferase/2-C-methyl-D-erythritol 2,4-cyclodiphosphate synthase
MAGGRLHLILLAGGRGLRAQDSDQTPKQFRPTGRGLLFTVSLREFLSLDLDSGFRPRSLTLAVDDPWRETAQSALLELDIPWVLAPAGISRTGSTWNAVQQLEASHSPAVEDLVAVHDAARPFASKDLLLRLAQAAAQSGGAVPGVPVADTIVQSDQGTATYLHRSLLQAVQTPQVFRWDQFQAAHQWAADTGTDFTDDGGLMASRGHSPTVVAGELDNWKVTTNGDWLRTKVLLDAI